MFATPPFKVDGKRLNDETGASVKRRNAGDNSLFSFLQFVKFQKLDSQEKLIHTQHLQALKRGDETYKDPATGYVVLTRLAHLRRGECCGNACRHCPYGQKGVPADKKKKRFNSAFFV